MAGHVIPLSAQILFIVSHFCLHAVYKQLARLWEVLGRCRRLWDSFTLILGLELIFIYKSKI